MAVRMIKRVSTSIPTMEGAGMWTICPRLQREPKTIIEELVSKFYDDFPLDSRLGKVHQVVLRQFQPKI